MRVDRTWVAQSAALAKAGGTKEFHLVTAITSDANSMFLYPQTKGLVEQDVQVSVCACQTHSCPTHPTLHHTLRSLSPQELGFDTLHIYRPGFLEAAREEPRLVDEIMTR